jgi:hypothetical protein
LERYTLSTFTTRSRATGQTALYIAGRGQIPEPIAASNIQRHVLVADAEAPKSASTRSSPIQTARLRRDTAPVRTAACS